MMNKPNARMRLIESASQLFYERGHNNVGITEVINQAEVAKMTLYNCFENKQDLVLAVLNHFLRQRRQMISDALSNQSSRQRKLKQFFAVADDIARQDNFRGCAFINAALQVSDPKSPIHALAHHHKIWIKKSVKEALFQNLKRDAADMKALQVLIIWDGAISQAFIQQSTAPIRAGLKAALDLLGPSRNSSAPLE